MQDGKDVSAAPPPIQAGFEEIDLGPADQTGPARELKLGGRRCFMLPGETGPKLVSAACPHMGGEVRLMDGRLECPLHGWTFDPRTGASLNAPGAALAGIDMAQRDGHLFARIPRHAKAVSATKPSRLSADLSIRLVAHSSLEIRCGSVTLLTDPWLNGPAMLGAWIQYPPPVTQAGDHHPDAIWISHEHSDHFHEPTLLQFARSTPIYFPDFPNQRIAHRLTALGFTEIHPMPFGERFTLAPGFFITCYEPASLWNDSIVLIEAGGFRLLNLNDAGLNRRIAGLIGPVDVVASAFTPGALGYPLTWTHISESEQDAMLTRSCQGMLQMLREAVRLYGCHGLLPYAGHFALWHPLHRRYVNRMQKNLLHDVMQAMADLPVAVIDLLPGEAWHAADGRFDRGWENRNRLGDREHLNAYLDQKFDAKIFELHHQPPAGVALLSPAELDAHFLRLNDVPEMSFCEDLTLQVIATDLGLRQPLFERWYTISGGRVSVATDFMRAPSPTRPGEAEKSCEIARQANLTMRVPATVLTRIVREHLSWDESHIGYWCEFSRSPDIFHGGFWRLLQAPYYRRPAGALPAPTSGRISEKTGIGHILERFGPPAERILRRYGLYCATCHKAPAETVHQAAAMHGIDSTQLRRFITELNAALLPTQVLTENVP